MKFKISEKYLNEALRLREEYSKMIKILDEKSPSLKKYRTELEEINSRVLSVDVNNINIKVEESVFKELALVDEKLLGIQKELQPVYDGIEDIQSQSDKLYIAITEKYPKMTSENIKNQIWGKVKHITV